MPVYQPDDRGRYTTAVAMDKLGRTDEALAVLEEAVTLARPGGWIRPFIESGAPMVELLKGLLKKKVAADYIGTILDAFGDPEHSVAADAPDNDLPRLQQPIAPSPGLPGATPLIEQLTRRETEVLELLAQRFYNKEIAEKLCVSSETVRTHVKHLYQKLDVSNRRAAITRASELGLLADGSAKSGSSSPPQ